MNRDMAFLFSLIFIGFLIYIMIGYVDIKKLNFNKLKIDLSTKKEGMTTSASSTASSSTSKNGVAGNAKQYATTLKSGSVKLSDELLINKYRTDYESCIMNMEDLVNNMMLKTVLSTDASNPGKTLEQLNSLFQSKNALSAVMKYVDSQ